VVYGVLNSESIFFEGHVDAPNRIIGWGKSAISHD
jgi:hypothetical protein